MGEFKEQSNIIDKPKEEASVEDKGELKYQTQEKEFQKRKEWFFESREIKPEDYNIIEKLSQIDKNLLIMDFHNYFSFKKESSAVDLQRKIKAFEEKLKEPLDKDMEELTRERIKLYKLLLEFVQKYDWCAAWNLVSVVEAKPRKRR